eukprot:13932-Heterococcus_DN1.PRE.1
MVVISTALLWLLWTCTAINLCARCTRAASAVHCSFALLTCYQNDLNMLSRHCDAGISVDTVLLLALSSRFNLSVGMPILAAISASVGLRPISLVSTFLARRMVYSKLCTCTGSLIVLLWYAIACVHSAACCVQFAAVLVLAAVSSDSNYKPASTRDTSHGSWTCRPPCICEYAIAAAAVVAAVVAAAAG